MRKGLAITLYVMGISIFGVGFIAGIVFGAVFSSRDEFNGWIMLGTWIGMLYAGMFFIWQGAVLDGVEKIYGKMKSNNNSIFPSTVSATSLSEAPFKNCNICGKPLAKGSSRCTHCGFLGNS